jgi:two-component system response regulator RegA
MTNQAQMRVMIVDEDDVFSARLGRAFRDRGFDVRAFSSVANACAGLRLQHFDVVITDLRVGDDNGLVVVEASKVLCHEPMILVLTAYANVQAAVLAVKLGATDFLAKPADIDEILEVLGIRNASGSSDLFKNPGVLHWEHAAGVYEQTGRNMSEAARRLGMHRRTLQRLLARGAPEVSDA